jgi:hypothetical protein
MRPLPPGGDQPGTSSIHYGVAGLFFNPTLFAALLSCVIAQVCGGSGATSLRLPLCAHWPEAAALVTWTAAFLRLTPHIRSQWLCRLLPCAVGQTAGSLAHGEGPAGLAASPFPRRHALFTHCKCGGHDHRPGFAGGHQLDHVCFGVGADADRCI